MSAVHLTPPPSALLPPRPRVIGVSSVGIMAIPHLHVLLGVERVVHLHKHPKARVDAVVCWGRKPNTPKARALADQRGVPLIQIEDGFLRSVGLGIDGDPPLSLVWDPVGIYYDATAESVLERWLAGREAPLFSLEDPRLLSRARALAEAIREHGISKYNSGSPDAGLPPSERRRVLVVDQTSGDSSLRFGCAAPGGLAAVVAAALDDHPDAEIVVKVHPDAIYGAAGADAARLLTDARVRVLHRHVQPSALFAEVDEVYTRTSQMGFEALLHGKRVVCFGVPFYAGWGLTEDRVPIARRAVPRTLDQLVAASLVLYASYLDPETLEPTTPERVVEHLAFQRRHRPSAPPPVLCRGVPRTRVATVPRFLAVAPRHVGVERNRPAGAPPRKPGLLLAWGRHHDAAAREARRLDVRAMRVAPGLLCALGRGRRLRPGDALTLESLHPRSSDAILLETLATHPFDDALRTRAAALRTRLFRTEGSAPSFAKALPHSSGARRLLVLVVSDPDAGLVGADEPPDDVALLRRVRDAHPDAYVLHHASPSTKPLALLRALRLAELVDRHVAPIELDHALAAADEVHVGRSVLGLEALARGKRTVVHGRPFYAGWGLTEDRLPFPERTRRLALDELLAAALILAPHHLHPVSRSVTTPEAMLDYVDRRETSAAFGRDDSVGWQLLHSVVRWVQGSSSP